jgi:hypothetical protein
VPVAVFGTLGLAIVVLIYIAIQESNRFEANCRSMGGHVHSAHSVGTGIGSKGKPVTTYNTTTFCLSADGRILDTE